MLTTNERRNTQNYNCLANKRYKYVWKNPCYRVACLFKPSAPSPAQPTRIGEHCRHLERNIFPAALRCMEKCRNDILAIFPQYFVAFDSAQSTLGNKREDDQFPHLNSFLAYVNRSNFKPADNADRAKLSLAQRLALHQCEARTIHGLKSHVELVEAYRWHQISSRRQEIVLTKLRNGSLPSNGLLLQIDFKENVRYPLSHLSCLNSVRVP